MQLLINHLGYEQFGHKQAVVQTATPISDPICGASLCPQPTTYLAAAS